jgi:hypothetical protein
MTAVSASPIVLERIPVKENLEARELIARFLATRRPSLTSRIANKLMRFGGKILK